MRVAAITRFKQGDLYEALKQANWTQQELSNRSGLSINAVSLYCCMKRRPRVKQAERIQQAFHEVGIYIDVLAAWPEQFKVKSGMSVVQVRDVPDEVLLEYERRNALQKESPTLLVESDILTAMQCLGPAEQDVIKGYFWDDERESEIAQRRNLSPQRINDVRHMALSKLRKYFERDERGELEPEWRRL